MVENKRKREYKTNKCVANALYFDWLYCIYALITLIC